MSGTSLAVKAAILITGIFSNPTFANQIGTPMDTKASQALLDKWSAIPDLSVLAEENPKGKGLLKEIPKLEKEFRNAGKPYQITKASGDNVECSTQDHDSYSCVKVLVAGNGRSFSTTGMVKHEIEAHGAPFPADLAEFLKGFPDPDKTELARRKELLEKWIRIPDLFRIAWNKEMMGGDRYKFIPILESRFRSQKKAFQLTELYRSMETCVTGEHRFGMAKLTLVNELGTGLEVWDRVRHNFEEHGAHLPTDVAAFLEKISLPFKPIAVVDNLEILKPESNFKDIDEAASSLVSEDLEFEFPRRAALRDNKFHITAAIINPTDKAIAVTLWQIGNKNPFFAHLVAPKDLQRKTPAPGAPLTPPPVPLPPFRFTLPPRTEVRFATQVDLADYEYKPGAYAYVQWRFHFWKAPEAKGEISVRLH